MEDHRYAPRRGENRRPDPLVRTLTFAERWKAALYFWGSVAFTAGLGAWWLAMSRHSWPH